MVVAKVSPDVFSAVAEARPSSQDYLGTHLVLIRSSAILTRALKDPAFQSFATGTEFERMLTLNRSLKVRRHPEAKDCMLVVSIVGPDEKQSVAMLNAIVNSYSRFLEETYKSVGDRTLELIVEAKRTLTERLENAEREQQEFRVAHPFRLFRQEARRLDESTVAIEAKLVAVQASLTEKEARLAWLERVIKSGDHAVALALKVNEWAERSGFNKLPNEVRANTNAAQAFVSSLKLEIAEDREVATAIRETVEQERKKLREQLSFEFRDEVLRNRVKQNRDLLEVIIRRLAEANQANDFGGYEARIVEQPRAKRKG